MAVALTSSSQRLMQEIYDEFLICKICFETYRNPKTLTCLHIFCTECLEKHMDAEVERSYRYMLYSRTITCPVCRKKTDLPSGGIRRLPDNFLVASLIEIVSRRRGTGKLPQCEICKPIGYHSGKEAVSRCLECSKLLCTACVELHRRTKVTRAHSLIDTEVEKFSCKVHQDEVVRFYCEPCEICICVLCTFQEHKGHNVQSFTEGMQKYQNSLDTLVASCRERITSVKKHLDLIKTCESEIRKAEDQIRDATIESISALRQTEKKQLEELYDVFGEDTIQFLKEKHVLQDVLDNLMSSCSLTEIILKDKSIELLLLRREIQDKLEVLLQGRVQTPPENIIRQVSYKPGQIIFGQLAVEGGSINENNNAMVAFRVNSYDSGVQTTWEDWEESSQSQTDDAKLGRRPERSDRSVNTCPLDYQNSTTMTERVPMERTSVQTEHMTLSDKGISTQNADFWSQFTNTPQQQFVDRSTLTTKVSMNESQTETKDLIDYRSTLCGPDILPMQTIGTITEPPDLRSRSTSTAVIQQADKKTATYKLITHDIGVDPVKVNTHDFGVMTKGPVGVEKAIGTKTVVLADIGTGSGACILNTIDAGTDTIWKGIRRVRHKATMHELLYNTQETDTENLIMTQERGSSPCPIREDEEAVISSKRKNSIITQSDAKRACTNETQTDLNLLTFTELLKDEVEAELKVINKGRQVKDQGTTMTSCVRVTDIGTGMVHVNIIDRGINTRAGSMDNLSTNTVKVCLVDSANGTPTKTYEDKGITTTEIQSVNKETLTVPTKMKEKGTETYVQSVDKATYMIQPVILSTGTNTPKVHTSDKVSETEFNNDQDNWTVDLSQSVGARVNAAATTIERDPKRPAISDIDYNKNLAPSMDPIVQRQSKQRGERDVTNVQFQDATTSTLAVETSNKETIYEPINISNRSTMTFVLTKDMGVQKRPHTLSRATSMKKLKTTDMQTSVTDLDIRSAPKSEKTNVDKVEQPEKSTATFKVELKNTGVGTPIVNFRDRQCSPIRTGMLDRSTSISSVDLAAKEKVPLRTTKLNKQVSTTDRGSSPTKFPEENVPKINTKEKAVSTLPIETRESGTGMAHILYIEKETCTPRITTMHKNMATENIRTADKQTATVDITATYRGLFTNQNNSVITVSRGTCTGPPKVVDRETSPIKELPYTVETGTNPVRKVYVSKGVCVTKADLMCPVDKFQRAGSWRPRVLPKNMPTEEAEPKFEPMATIQETSDDEAGCSGSGNSSPGCSMTSRIRMFEEASHMENSTTHREKLWRTAPRLGKGNGGNGCDGNGGTGGCSARGNGGRVGCSTSSACQGGPSTFSANGSTQTSSILCKVETGTSTPPVEMEDKAMCTESISVDGKITECISKLRAVSQRLENQTSVVLVESDAATGPIYSKADSFRKESVTTQATSPPVLSGQILTRSNENNKGSGPEHEGLAPLSNLSRRPLRRQSGRLGDMETACPPFLARRELHSIDTGMVGGGGAVADALGSVSTNGSDNGNGIGHHRSKARKQRLDMTQLLHRPPGAMAAMGEGILPLSSQHVPYRPSLAGLRMCSLDECSRQLQTDAAHRRLRAKMSAIESPEEEHAPSSPLLSSRKKSFGGADQGNVTLRQRTDKPPLDNLLGSVSSSSSPSDSPKIENRHRGPKIISHPSPTISRKVTKDRTSKSRSPPIKKKDVKDRTSKSRSPPVKREKVPERRESNSSDHKGVCCGLAGSPRVIQKSTTTIRAPKKTLKEIGRLQKLSSSSFSSFSSSSSNEDGRDSPGDQGHRRSKKEP